MFGPFRILFIKRIGSQGLIRMGCIKKDHTDLSLHNSKIFRAVMGKTGSCTKVVSG